MSHSFKISRFTLAEPVSSNYTALFHTMSRAMVVVPAPGWPNLIGKQNELLIEPLFQQGFLVPADRDEDLLLEHWRRSQAYDLTHLVYLISPTFGCNMACSYCIHGNRKRPEHMSPSTARDTLDFIQSDLELKQPQTVHLDFGGAEALINPKTVLYLAEGLYRFCQGRNIAHTVGIISNGLALTPEFIRRLLSFGLTKVRVTVSGPRDIHDRHRPTRDNGPTYERIMNNLEKLKGLAPVALAGQYDPFNGEHLRFPELLDDLIGRGLSEVISDVQFGPIIRISQNESAPYNPPDVGCLQDEDPGRYLWLQDQITEKGFSFPNRPPQNTCLVNYRNNMVIDAHGHFVVCPSMMDHPELEYGDVRHGVDLAREAHLLARSLPEACVRECALAPLCDGGCREQALRRTGNFDGVNCFRQTYEHLTRAYIRRAVESFQPALIGDRIS